MFGISSPVELGCTTVPEGRLVGDHWARFLTRDTAGLKNRVIDVQPGSH